MTDPPSSLKGRCGSCAYFHSVRFDAARNANVGECAFGTWPPVRPETSSCPAYVQAGSLAKVGAAKVKRAVQGRMRPDRPDEDDFEFNQRHGPRAAAEPRVAGTPAERAARVAATAAPTPRALRAPVEIEVDMDEATFRTVLREILAEELGLGDVPIGERWKGGEIVIKPGKPGLAEKRLPIETFFHKIVMVRDRLRVLEQKINGSKQLSDEDKVTIQQYITGAYGSLTTFNVLFREEDDRFVGAATDKE